MGYFQLGKSIYISQGIPVDGDRYLAANVAARDQLVTNDRAYEGLQVYVESDQTVYVLKDVSNNTWTALSTGDSNSLVGWEGITVVDNSISIGGGDPFTEDKTIDTGAYDLGITGSMSITGNLNVDGSITYLNVVDLNVSDNIITINSGMTGTPPSTLVSGMKVDRGDASAYYFLFAEDTDTFRVGISGPEPGLPGDTQAVATREDQPGGSADIASIPFWNDSEKRFDTVSDFTFDSSNGLSIADPITATDGINLTGLVDEGQTIALVVPAAAGGKITTQALGTNAFSSDTYVTETIYNAKVADIDASIVLLVDEDTRQDASIVALFGENDTQNSHLSALDASVGLLVDEDTRLDASIADLIAEDTRQDASIVALFGENDTQDLHLSALDSSVGLLVDEDTRQDASIVALFGENDTQNLHLSALDASVERIDVSLNNVIEATSLFYTQAYIDGSLNDKLDLAGGTMTGLLTLDSSGIALDGETITTIDTSANGVSGLDTAIPTSAAVTALVNSAISAGVTASNGLTEVEGDIQLGGALTKDTSIDLATHSLRFEGITTSVNDTPFALVQDPSQGGTLKIRELGTMTWETASEYPLKKTGTFTVTGTSEDLDVSDVFTGGPYQVQVFEAGEMVYVGVSYVDTSISLSWTTGSLSGNIDYIVTG